MTTSAPKSAGGFLILEGRSRQTVCCYRSATVLAKTRSTLLTHKTTYHDPGADYYERRHSERARRLAIQALERQGYRVILEPAA